MSALADFDHDELEDLLESQVEQHPDMEADDLFKLLLQAYRGPGHAVSDPIEAWVGLRNEARTLAEFDVRAWEEPVEILRPSVEVARVHLRPYLRMGGDLRVLHETFLESARRFAAIDTTEALRRAIAATRDWLRDETLDVEFAERDFSRLVADFLRSAAGVPRHSARYRELYAPAYRVVCLPFATPESRETGA